ncbi:MAG: hypothetical protein FJ403_05245 [Verrucomicrobia bacterium]|nr:hypothetical protein [Verrucomicrobiota bacterium]
MKTRSLPNILSFALSALLALTSVHAADPVISNAQTTSLGVVTGGDAGEGLDLEGNIIYALAIGADVTLAVPVRGVIFKGLINSEVPGANLVAGNRILNWYNLDYGDSVNDDNLELATRSIRWSAAGDANTPQVILTLQKIKVGGKYKVQLIFGEQCCNRGFDVFFNDVLAVKDFNPGVQHGGIANGTQTALITHELTATAPTLVLRLDGRSASSDYPDHNAIFNAITVEEVSAPGDSDNDGLSDAWEQLYFNNLTAIAGGDPDGDGLTNAEELTAGTNPTLADTDKDGLNDGLEVKTHKTNPGRADTDNDGLSDFDEVTVHKSDPLKSDGDGDLLSDAAEINIHKTNPAKADTDGDGLSDYHEIHFLTDPLVASTKPSKTVASVFTGPGAGQGLDFAGTFPYAISFGNEQPGGQIGNALFTSDSVDGFTVLASQVANNWNQGVNYGSTPEQEVLSSVMGSIRWSDAGNATTADVTATFSKLQVGAAYKLQLLFGERLWARGFNVTINGKLVARDFAPFQWQGGFVGPGNATPRTNGVVITHSFIATSTEAVVVLDGRPVRNPAMPDRNAIINGATLERVSPAVDSDNDGLWDAWEMENFGNLTQNGTGDPDNDGLRSSLEFTAGSDPSVADTDGDGLNDGQEVNTTKTDPVSADTDKDLLSDGAEINIYKSDPLKADTDGDGLADGAEVLTHKTDPFKADTDGDGSSDGKEVNFGGNPIKAEAATKFSNIEIKPISGGDPGEGLDLQGNFVYAVNVSSAGVAGKAGDADFTADNAAGVTVTAPSNIPNWSNPAFGDTAADNVIEKVNQSIRYGPTMRVELANIVPGSTYKLQLMFYEQCCANRGFNVYVDGETLAADFSPPEIQGGVNNTAAAAAISAEVVTQRDRMTIVLTTMGRTREDLTDPNAILDGLTLELIRLGDVPVAAKVSSVKADASGITITFDSISGRRYQVEYRENVATGAWQPVGNPVTATGASSSFTDNDATRRARGRGFYRIRSQ